MVDVSVVVPTYDTGEKLAALLTSLQGQTLAADRYEIVLVDDGSDDDTWERLEAARARDPRIRTSRIPNSGWPGRPRNVGTDLARGRYVFYCDHDDELYPDALELLVELGDRTGADVVIGKEVRTGAATIGPELFLADRDRADLFDDHVLALITPHKLFRTAFLREHGIRFPEGRRRLEDAVLLTEVYTRTDRIAVLASRPCYRWIIYDDGSNNSASLGDPDAYFRSLEDVFDAIEAAPVPPERKDDLLRFWYASRVLRRLTAFWFDQWDDAYREQAITVMGDLAARRVPERLDAGLPPPAARRSALLRAGDRSGLVALARRDDAVRVDLDWTWQWTPQGLRIQVSGVQTDGEGRPLLYDETEVGVFARDDTDRRHDLSPFLDDCWADLALRDRGTDIEWYAARPVPVALRRTPDGSVLAFEADWLVDPRTFALGRPMDDGVWGVFVHTRILGETTKPRPEPADEPGAALIDGLAAVAFRHNGKASLTVGVSARFLRVAIGHHGEVTASGTGRKARIAVALPRLFRHEPRPGLLRLLVDDTEVDADFADGAIVATTALETGDHPIRLAIGERRTRVLAVVTARGGLRGVQVGDGEPLPVKYLSEVQP